MEKESKVSGNVFDIKVIKRLMVYAKPYRSRFYILTLLTVLSAALSIAKPLVIKDTIDNYIEKGDLPGLTNMTLFLFFLLIVHGIVNYFNTYMAGWLGQTVIKDIRMELYRHLMTFRLKFFDQTPIGRLVTRNVSDIESLSNIFSEGLAGIVSDLLLILAILVIMFYENWVLTLYSLGALPLLLLSTYVFKEKVKGSFNEVRTAVANLNSFVQEHITGMNIVQIFNSEKREYDKFEKINKEHRNANLKSVLYYSIYFPVSEFISSLSIALLVWYGAQSVLKDMTTVGTLTSFIMFITMFFRPIRMVADRFNTIQMSIVSSDRIFRILDNEEDVALSGTEKPETIRGDVKFENVWFSYGKEEYVLKNINFEAQSGKTIALVGATGAGKSSVINLLSRFYEINKGAIYIDGKNIQQYDIGYLRGKIGVVMQDVFLFSDTIRNNITLNNPAISEEAILNAIDLVGAGKFIEKLPGGLDYNVMERGSTLSVGQRQLISFVRTLVYNPRIIVLDEATASIDSETEELIQEAIKKLMFGRTSIVIAHRLSTIQKADTILVFDKGEIKESGTHESLLEHSGLYANLYEMQYKMAR
ncbi:MAG TPA: ABC transporter ATP-binding protein [Cytophagaceae bacterium]|jgi:ATP-binding cassette subfamily B multidrug efflux pump|nr:ABC transporter ATP-binding protein [Cytophagaceae bacterium]